MNQIDRQLLAMAAREATRITGILALRAVMIGLLLVLFTLVSP